MSPVCRLSATNQKAPKAGENRATAPAQTPVQQSQGAEGGQISNATNGREGFSPIKGTLDGMTTIVRYFTNTRNDKKIAADDLKEYIVPWMLCGFQKW